MGQTKLQSRAVWALAERQHRAVAQRQLLAHGLSAGAIHHRIEKGRLHPVHRGVYAIGRPQLTRYGTWMAAVLACGTRAALSHSSASALAICHVEERDIEISVPGGRFVRRPGIVAHRRATPTAADLTHHQGIPVTTPACTVIDVASRPTPDRLEAAINEADRRDLIDPDTLLASLDQLAPRRGVGALGRTLDAPTFLLTDSALERRFLPVGPVGPGCVGRSRSNG
jgi:predicted transcriptional regulator of viral defense system